jgi:tetratricopeptide (TPR) repeat protein
MALAKCVIAVLLGLAGGDREGVSEAALLEQAETAFHEGRSHRDIASKARQSFRSAAAHYEALRQGGADNVALYRNLGNAYLLAGELPQAILSYRRGLRLAPGDRDVQTSLTYARTQVVYAGPGSFGRAPEENWLVWICRGWPRERLVLAVLAYGVAWLALTRWRMNRQTWLLRLGSAALATAALLAASLGVAAGEQWHDTEQPLVVIAADGVLLRKGNGLAYPLRYDTPLNRGVEARLRVARGDWLHIELSGGETGWVPRASVLVDIR